MADAILRRAAVKQRCGLGKTAMYAAIKAGTFPKPVQLGKRSVGWLESSINAWIDSRPIKGTRAAAQS